MNIEEAIKHCKEIIKQNTTIVKDAYKSGDINTMQLVANCDKDNIAIETILNELATQSKQIDLMTTRIKDETLGDIICDEIENKEPCENRPAECKQCIVEYFTKKASEKE